MKTLRPGDDSSGKRMDWRTYQSGLKRERVRKKNAKKIYQYITAMALFGVCVYIANGIYMNSTRSRHDAPLMSPPSTGVLVSALNAQPSGREITGPSPDAAVSTPEAAESAQKPSLSTQPVEASAPEAGISIPDPEASTPEGAGLKPESVGASAEGSTREMETAAVLNEASAEMAVADPEGPLVFTTPVLDKTEVQLLFDRHRFVNLRGRAFDYDFDGRRFHVETSIDEELQQFMLGMLQQQYAQSIGIVIMEPETGRILSMVSHDREDPTHNACTESVFPAASIFKIVTAAAAVEECGFQPDSKVAYVGAKHTLYKSQLKRIKHSKANRISLRDSFAQSVNPVFGKLGAQYLGKKELMSSAEAFGFNQEIDFELPMAPSSFSVSDEPYNLAEIASGFNRTTLLSPMHGAIIASAMVANEGRLIEPSIVDQINDGSGRIIYKSRPETLNRAVSPETSRAMRSLMRETVLTGTCRKTFRGITRSPVLSRLNIGGKSGSINSRTVEGRRFDWFVGYAEEKKGNRKIVMSIVVAHQNFIGTKANMYARKAIEKYFEDVGSKI